MNIIWSANNSIKGSRDFCLEGYCVFVGFGQEMANYDTCTHYYAIRPQGVTTLCIQVSLSFGWGSIPQRSAIKQNPC
jgi:hypothetical protein